MSVSVSGKRHDNACYTPPPYVPNDDDHTDANGEPQLVALSLIVRNPD